MKIRRTNNGITYLALIVVSFVIFGICVAGINLMFPVETSYTKAEIQYLKDAGYLHDNIFEDICHNINNAWLNFQDLMKGGE